MLDNDNLTYTYQKRAVGNTAAKQSERALITLERSQKLDLLIHLLTNLQQSLIVCGPEGIGKTTLLQTFQDNRKDLWHICLLQGASALSFESTINQLSRSLNLSNSSVNFDLSSLRAFCDKQKVVLIIDNAGELVPGLIGELIAFAESLSGLRLVFAMTYDEFHVKSASDKAMDDCHFIELPPLNQKQCAEYLQNLSAQPGAMLSFNAITDNLVEELFRETHGIPGKILAELPKLSQYQSRQQRKLGMWAGILAVVAAAGFAVKLLLPAVDNQNVQQETVALPESHAQMAPIVPTVNTAEAPTPPAEKPVATDTTVAEPVPAPMLAPAPQQTPPIAGSEAAQTVPEPSKPAAVAAPAPVVVNPAPLVTPSAPTESVPPSVPVTVAAEQPVQPPVGNAEAPVENKLPANKPGKAAATDDIGWIMAQPADNYTLQIMVLSSKDSVNRFLKKYADYRDSLKYYPIDKNGQEKYVLIYGSFQTVEEASQYKTVMPAEFKQAMEKRFRSVQKESRR